MTVTKTQLADAYSAALNAEFGEKWEYEFSRRALVRMLESSPELQVVGSAKDGEEGIRRLKELEQRKGEIIRDYLKSRLHLGVEVPDRDYLASQFLKIRGK